MKWSTLIAKVAERSGVPRKDAQRVLTALVHETLDALTNNDEVLVRGLGTFETRWRAHRVLRSVSSGEAIRLDGRYVPRFKPSTRLRRILAAQTPQLWQDPAHQAALDVAEGLFKGLKSAVAPREIEGDEELSDIDQLAATTWGAAWAAARQEYISKVPAEIRDQRDYLTVVVRKAWALAGSAN